MRAELDGVYQGEPIFTMKELRKLIPYITNGKTEITHGNYNLGKAKEVKVRKDFIRIITDKNYALDYFGGEND